MPCQDVCKKCTCEKYCHAWVHQNLSVFLNVPYIEAMDGWAMNCYSFYYPKIGPPRIDFFDKIRIYLYAVTWLFKTRQ